MRLMRYWACSRMRSAICDHPRTSSGLRASRPRATIAATLHSRDGTTFRARLAPSACQPGPHPSASCLERDRSGELDHRAPLCEFGLCVIAGDRGIVAFPLHPLALSECKREDAAEEGGREATTAPIRGNSRPDA